MGVRLHYAKRYDVKYSESAFGNWLQSEINNLLKSVAENLGWSISWWDEYSEEFEIEKEALTEIIEELKTYEDSQLDKRLLESGLNVSEIVLNLELALANSDPDNDFVHFAWF